MAAVPVDTTPPLGLAKLRVTPPNKADTTKLIFPFFRLLNLVLYSGLIFILFS
jgi:hypothetical protein